MNKTNKNFWIFFTAFTFFSSAQAAKNIVLFIGDGMGQGIVTATRLKHRKANGTMHMDLLPYTAIVKTYSIDSPVTDSAAAATAMACGVKTVNDVLGQDATAIARKQDGKPVESIAEIAKKMGKSVGLVTTTEITHATPAGFYAKVNDRDLGKTIASQLLKSDFDLFLGGGQKYFDMKSLKKDRSVSLVQNKKELKRTQTSPGKKVLGLFSQGHLSYELDRKPESEEPSIMDLSLFALEKLNENKKGFFLMVEGGRIDHALHANMTPQALYETDQFDKTIGKVLEVLEKQNMLQDTLVLVTADHETGGLSINGYPPHEVDVLQYPHLTYASGPAAKNNPPSALLPVDDGYAFHTGIDVTLYAKGAGAEQVRGTIDNTDIFKIMKRNLE